MNTSTTMTRHDAETRARQIFYAHAGIYVLVNSLLAYQDLTTSPERLWFFWPLAGWGAGLAAHAVGVFVTHKATDRVLQRVAHREERQERRAARHQSPN